MLQFNYKEILECDCSVLEEYAFLITTIKAFKKKGYNLEDSIQRAVEVCAKEQKLANYLRNCGSEVSTMLFDEYTIEQELETERQEGRAEGRQEGRVEGRAEGEENMIVKALTRGKSIKDIAEFLGLGMEEIQKIAKKNALL